VRYRRRLCLFQKAAEGLAERRRAAASAPDELAEEDFLVGTHVAADGESVRDDSGAG
jgi:hypothetical protein